MPPWTKMPKIANVQCSRLKFEAGDRIVVRVHSPLTDRQKGRLKEIVQEWAGADVSVLIVDLRLFDVEVEKRCLATDTPKF